jgi:hypothetical protein
LFSLTPILLLAIPGCWIASRRATWDQSQSGLLIGATSVVCIAFYLFWTDQAQRNYGGQSCAFRQLLWLQPLWVILSVPVFDACSERRAARILIYLLLALSALSASYPTWSPWTQSWIWNAQTYWGIPTMG